MSEHDQYDEDPDQDAEEDMDDFEDDAGSGMEEFEDRRKMSKEEREEDEFAAQLLANHELVDQGEMDGEVGGEDMPDMSYVRPTAVLRAQASSKELRFARKSEQYQKDREEVMFGLAMNDELAPRNPFPFLASDLGARMSTISVDEMAELADMVRARRRVNNRMQEERTTIALMTLGMYGVGWAAEQAGAQFEYDLEGYASRLRVAAAAEPELMMRLYGRYVRKWIDRITGGKGNADLMQLGMMMYDTAQATHDLNVRKAEARKAGAFGFGEQAERENAVRDKLRQEDEARAQQAREAAQPAVRAEELDDLDFQAQEVGMSALNAIY